jgi:diguanylate cyclase (GGDEF)-like protein
VDGFGPIRQGRLQLLQPEGRWGWIELSVRRLQGLGRRRFEGALRSGDGAVNLQDGFVITLNPVDGQVLQEQRLLRQATTDPLTGLASRAAILDWLQERLARGQQERAQKLALLFCDFDNFKGINDGYGHAAGDLVLTTTADRLKATIRQNDRAGRLGGDEFLVLLDEIPSLEQAMVVAEKLQKVTATAIPYGTELIDVSLSIGVALHGAGEDADLFLRRADRAMFAAKAAGRNQVVAL